MTSNTHENSTFRVSIAADSSFRPAFWMLIVLAGLLTLGCGRRTDFSDEPARTLIAPIQPSLPFQFEGTVRRNWGGDEFEIIEGRAIHYVRVAGVIGPEPGQPHWRAARRLFWKGFIGKEAKIKVFCRDECMCEVGTIHVGDVDFGLRLLEHGLGWIDDDFSSELAKTIDFKSYRLAEQKARKAKVGIWSDEFPPLLEPREYREQQERLYLKYLRALNK